MTSSPSPFVQSMFATAVARDLAMLAQDGTMLLGEALVVAAELGLAAGRRQQQPTFGRRRPAPGAPAMMGTASLPQKRSALDVALEAIAAAGRRSVRSDIRRGAAALIEQQHRLDAIIPGLSRMSPAAALAEIRRLKDISRQLGVSGSFAYNATLLLALRQAYVAVRLAHLRERAARVRRPAE